MHQKTVCRPVGTLLMTVGLLAAMLGTAESASAGTYCTARYDRVVIYDRPGVAGRAANHLDRGPTVLCGSSSDPEFAALRRADNGVFLGYAYWIALNADAG